MESFLSSLMEPYMSLRLAANQSLEQYEPVVVAVVVVMLWEILRFQWGMMCSFSLSLNELGLKGFVSKAMMDTVKVIPGGAGYIKGQQAKVVDKMQAGQKAERESWQTELPSVGYGTSVIEKLKAEKSRDRNWRGKCSGAVYIGGSDCEGHFSLINEAYSLFSHTNPLHSDVWPSVKRFEAEVVAMTATLLGSKTLVSGGQVCGNMTSGGTESILMALKSSRDYMMTTRGVTNPEIVIPESAHSAYDKAAQYFKIKLRRAPVGKDLRADVKAVKRLINSQTILIVGSAPSFPHGVIDPIEELGALALKRRICFHVDLCLGGFVLPFARKLGYAVPAFDFTVPGVTSISTDVHKYGLGPKGSSVVLYRNHEIRKHQFVAVTEWSGGLYISPSMAGSRAGGLIAGAWAALMAVGENGYMEGVQKIMETSKRVQLGINEIPGLYVLGKPDITVVAFASDEVDIYKVNDFMSSREWNLNALQRPASVHICITLQHVDVVDKFLQDLADAVVNVRENPDNFEDGMAPIYGAAAKMPDRGTVGDILVAYMDGNC